MSRNTIMAIFLIIIGAAGRIALQDYPNIETIMVVTFIAGVWIREWYALLVPLVSLGISDLYLGNLSATSHYSLILLFTYSGFLLVGIITRHYHNYFRKHSSSLSATSMINTSIYGLIFVAVYDVWTNFGAFLLMYPHTPSGLLLCYFMAVPFMLYHLFSGVLTFALIVAPVTSALHRTQPEGAIAGAEECTMQ